MIKKFSFVFGECFTSGGSSTWLMTALADLVVPTGASSAESVLEKNKRILNESALEKKEPCLRPNAAGRSRSAARPHRPPSDA